MPIKTAADTILKYMYFFFFSKKRKLDISCESLPYFLLKNKNEKKLKKTTVSYTAIMLGSLQVKMCFELLISLCPIRKGKTLKRNNKLIKIQN